MKLTINVPEEKKYVPLSKTYTQEKSINIKDVTILKKISRGASGIIYKVGYKNNILAMKTVSPRKTTRIKNTHLVKETDMLRSLKHKNVINYEGHLFLDNTLYLLMAYCKFGSIANLLKTAGTFPEQIIRSICYQLLTGLKYIHNKNIIHRDIKCGNVTVTSDGVCKIIDFELAKYSNDKIKKCQGTWAYMSPESIKSNALCSQKIDIWSLGIMCIKMSTYKPANDANIYNIVNNTLDHPSPKLSNKCKFSNEFRNFVDLALLKNPDKRPSAKELLTHKWFGNSRHNNADIDSCYEVILRKYINDL